MLDYSLMRLFVCYYVVYPQIGLKQYCFLVFLAVCALVATYIVLIVPETKNKTFLEIQNVFQSTDKRSADGTGTTLLATSL